MTFGAPVPILRSFDEGRARAFWLDYLGFAVDWEHRFEPGLPLYMQIRRGTCILHLSEHHGDGTPGGRLRVEVGDLDALAAELAAKPCGFARPRIVAQPWGSRELGVADPFGTTIVFWQASGEAAAEAEANLRLGSGQRSRRGNRPAPRALPSANVKEDNMADDHAKGAGKEIKGSVKEAAGKLTGDRDTEAEGKMDKTEGKAQRAWGDVKDVALGDDDRR